LLAFLDEIIGATLLEIVESALSEISEVAHTVPKMMGFK